jgi:hypothetical protein
VKSLIALALGAATGLAGLGIAQASPSFTAKPLTAPHTGQIVTLGTGDQVLVRDGFYTPLSANSLAFFQSGNGDRYFVPSSALPYLSHQLDPSLFDATALARTGDTGTVPVRLTFAAGSTPTAPADITLTSVSGRTATGYVTTASGPALAAALRTGAGADHAAHRTPGSTPLVPGLTGISLAGAATPPVVAPRYPLHVLQINVNDLTGAPVGSAEVELVDMDDVRTVATAVPITNGLNRLTVPAGHYLALALLQDLDANGDITSVHTVTQQFTVPDTAGATTTTTLDERAANALIGVSVPKPVTAQYESTTFVMSDPTGRRTIFGWGGLGATMPQYVSPTAAPAVGSLDYTAEWGASSSNPDQNYRYDVVFGSANGVPAQEHDTVTADQITTVRDRISADPALHGLQVRFGTGNYNPALAGFGSGGVAYPVTTPGEVTDYLASNRGNEWQQYSLSPDGVYTSGDVQTYLPGQSHAVDWSHGPLAPGFGQHTGGRPCEACFANGTLDLAFDQFGDSDPAHEANLVLGPPTSQHFTLYRDGTSIADGNGLGVELTDMPSTPATYRAVYDLSMAGNARFSQSTASHTDLTVAYAPSTRSGSVLPALTVNYRLATDATNTSSSPVQVLDLRVGHASYDGVGSAAPITSVSVRVSFDNGSTWQATSLVGAAGNYVAFWPNPKAGGSPSIRVTATDANGGSIAQTVTDAYTVTAAAQANAGRVGNVRDVCGPAEPGFARCLAEARTDREARADAGASTDTEARTDAGARADAAPQGYSPADLRAAYNLPATGGANQTVAVVDAGDDASAEADLGVYRSTYGLPACTSANGCFRKLNQRGAASPLPADAGWGEEISLDLDMVSAACPQCHILLVEADSTSLDDLGASVNAAVAAGATEVTNSYGATEDSTTNADAADYAHPGVAIVACSGDLGFGIANAPASYQSVVSVGGTSLSKATNARGWTETAWNGSASGCSAWVDKPSWQHDPNCPGRMVADVAADGDPGTGPAVYDGNDGIGWDVVGGTSAASPFIAGVIGLAANPDRFPNASYLYSHATALNDVTSGNNSGAQDCGGDYECDAVAGYDGPTGNGTPNGIGPF